MKGRMEISAGGIICRRQERATQICLIATNGGKIWQLPKGFIEQGETQEQAALREVAEETGLRGEIVQPLDRIEYWYVWDYGDGPERVHKFVYFFLMRYLDGSTDDHDHEADEARWFSIADARKRLTHDNELRILSLAEKALREVE